jgi:hypothetical protein
MNNFPVHCYVVRRSAIGEEADPLKKVLEKAGADLSKSIIEAVVKQVAFSLAISIALMFIPILGQAIAGLMAITQLIAGKKYEKDTKDVIQDASDDIKARAELSAAQIKAAAEEVYTQELPAGREMALSTQSLDGLGSKVKKAVSKVGSAISRVGSAFDDAVPVCIVKKLIGRDWGHVSMIYCWRAMRGSMPRRWPGFRTNRTCSCRSG